MAVRTTGAVIGSFVLGVVVAFALLYGAGYLLPPAARNMYVLAVPVLAAIALLFGGCIAAACANWLMLRQHRGGQRKFDSDIIHSFIDVLSIHIAAMSQASDKTSRRQAQELRHIRCQLALHYDNLPEFERERLILELNEFGTKEDLAGLEELEQAAVSTKLKETAHSVRSRVWDKLHGNT